MKSLKTLVSLTALAVCMGAASMASAQSFSPANQSFTTNSGGTITVKSPSSFGAAVTCNISFTGKVRADGSAADITAATVSGSNQLCSLPHLTNLPWVLSPAGTVTNVGYTIAAIPPLIPATNCGPSTIAVALSNVTGGAALSATNQPLSGSCTVVTLSVTAPGVSIVP
ncbi:MULTISPECIES: alkane oxidation protein activator PraB [unclassified Pseudomonas]|uniref:alkane oxidation protein activator PraB n=1 Tax=unclassified Pseudomonas TaxID=196821 RepID=UPI000EE52F13|nr:MULTISPECIES: alkane oxidation protein activator PraB [unclassified Pseudomonas]MCS4246406.1 hypothetical protein [Pseudomonas sp. BIGb0164]NWE21260.1 protein activator of alkane oxidation PraB [Pseudomonas sp. P7548]HCT07856.1 protein activator of alkane oxidation PraB [Pseudomonas sp.]